MKRSVDLTSNNLFSDNWNRDRRLYEPHEVKLPHRVLPWEKTDDELAKLKSRDTLKSYRNYNTLSWTNMTSSTRLNDQSSNIEIINTIIDDFISIREVHSDEELDTFNVVGNTISRWVNLSDDITSNSSNTATFTSGSTTYRMTYSLNGNDIIYTSSSGKSSVFVNGDKKARFCEEPGEIWYLGSVAEIREKKKTYRLNQEYQKLSKESREKDKKRSERSDYLFNNLDMYEDIFTKRIRSYDRWKSTRHNIEPAYVDKILTSLIPDDEKEEFWYSYMEPYTCNYISSLSGTRRSKVSYKPYDSDDLFDFPHRYNAIREEFTVYVEEEIFPRKFVQIQKGDKKERISLLEGVVKYKGKDYGEDTRKFSWQPKGRKEQKYDKVFADREDDWDIKLLPFIKELPEAL